MSEWQPIETAPVGVKVRLGWWEDYSYYSGEENDLRWKTNDGIAREMEGFWLFRKPVLTYEGKRATHWQYWPEPPK